MLNDKNPVGVSLRRISLLISILLCCSDLFISKTRANIVDLNGFRLSPLVLVKKSDFTYSGGSQDEDYAAVRFDLAMQLKNQIAAEEKNFYALMIITADQDGSDDLISLLTNGKTEASEPSDAKVERK